MNQNNTIILIITFIVILIYLDNRTIANTTSNSDIVFGGNSIYHIANGKVRWCQAKASKKPKVSCSDWQ